MGPEDLRKNPGKGGLVKRNAKIRKNFTEKP
jgi:hypothetical protein